MIDFGVAFDKLAQFETPDEIADFLQEHGIKGLRSAAESCPISTWIRTQTGEFTRSNRMTVRVFDSPDDMSFRDWRETSEGMKHFMFAFDGGCYPELIGRVE